MSTLHTDRLQIWPAEDHPLLQLPERISPHVEELERSILGWADDFALLDDDRARRKLERTRLGELIARSYPRIEPDRIEAMAGWFVWAFVIDDCFDDRVEDYGVTAGRVLDVLAGVPVGSPTRLEAQLTRMWELASARCSRHWRMRFSLHMAQFMAAFEYEAANRGLGRAPGPVSYTQLRRASGGITPSLDLLELAAGREVPVLIHESEQLRAMFDRAADVVVWVNDVVSLEKELAAGETSNGVLVLAAERDLGLQDAVTAVYDLVAAQIEEFHHTRADLTRLLEQWAGLTADDVAAVELFVDGMRSWMRGNLEWSRTCSRYRVADGVRLSTDTGLVTAPGAPGPR
ncbi:terpene synthase family protein [Pseudonocardia sp. HH130630-07]|uniref:terpene synthase family protein n=1 Tax=Pseudonocardia sp. HH130630-07 TaxID=1690815 RepID=UPI0008151B84|nr:hypothetical protein [Pseudonocardia sp. HH130630-07]ANY07338.1 hypothetical protein AFB00_14760 [Pseudonocardia sp. HH130630-07]